MAANANAGARMFYVRQSDGRAYEFCPVPLISDSREHASVTNNEIDSLLAVNTSLTFNGYLLPELPALSGVNENASCLELLDRKKDQLTFALSENRGNLIIVDASGYTVLNEYPVVRSISFEESQMVSHLKYSITFEYETEYGETKIKDYGENWSVQQNEDDTYSITHTVDAVGIPDLPAATGALKNAQNFVLSRSNAVDVSKFPFSNSPYAPALTTITSFGAYNHIRSEESNDAAGSYSLTETWIMASGAFSDDRTISHEYTLNDAGNVVETININGTVVGRGDTTFARYDNAIDGFTNFVSPQIGFDNNSGFTSKSRVDNRFAGTVSYSYSTLPSGSGVDDLESQTISRSFQFNEDGTVSQTVSTSAKVRLGSSASINEAESFCFANNYPIDSVDPPFSASLSGNIESTSKQVDELTKAYSLTRIFREQGTASYREEYEISRDVNADTSTVRITVQGTVYGLGFEHGTNTEVRFAAASGAYTNIISKMIYGRAMEIAPTGTCISSSPVQQSLGWSRKAGRVTYSQSFDNRFLTSNPNITRESIQVTYQLPADVFAELGVPFKSTGPIFQDMQTVTSYGKSLRISYTMTPDGIGQSCGATSSLSRGALELIGLAESNILVSNTVNDNVRGEKPVATRVFKTQDEYSMSEDNVFTRNVSWKW